jgi:hypothetical protein
VERLGRYQDRCLAATIERRLPGSRPVCPRRRQRTPESRRSIPWRRPVSHARTASCTTGCRRPARTRFGPPRTAPSGAIPCRRLPGARWPAPLSVRLRSPLAPRHRRGPIARSARTVPCHRVPRSGYRGHRQTVGTGEWVITAALTASAGLGATCRWPDFRSPVSDRDHRRAPAVAVCRIGLASSCPQGYASGSATGARRAVKRCMGRVAGRGAPL